MACSKPNPDWLLTLSTHNSIHLWKRAKAGDRHALESLLRSHQDQIFRFCRARLPNESMAIEATQETATRIIAGLNDFQGRSKISTWILGIANNICHESIRKNKSWAENDSRPLDSIPDSSEPASDRLSRQSELGKLKQAIENLPERQNAMIVLRYFEGMSHKEIATTLAVSVGTVKATLHQAVEKLKIEFHLEDA